MKVVDIEVHEYWSEYTDWIAAPLMHYYGPQKRVLYVAHTDTGLVGLGEYHAAQPELVQRYIGTNPYDWLGDVTSLGLGTAMYDLMGQAAGVPVWQLFGPRQRAFVPIGSWTVSTHPEHMAEAVRRYAAMGFTWLKFHLSPFENVLDQTEAMARVAPPGFRIHYDFTMHGTDDHMPQLLQELAKFPICGCFEDPLPGEDLEGYVELRQRTQIPIVLHHFATRATYEVFRRPADAYMLGHYTIGEATRRAGLFDAMDAPFMLQNVGGQITRAMAAHMMAAFPSATFHMINDTETRAGDVVQECIEPVNGFYQVPEGPGLGLTLDREALAERLAFQPEAQAKWIVRTTYANGTRMYNIHDPAESLFMVRPDHRLEHTFSYNAPLSTDYWDDDGTPEWRAMFNRLESDGMVLEK
jgi:galactonate dehydratase